MRLKRLNMKDANGVAGAPPGPGEGGLANGYPVVRHDAGQSNEAMEPEARPTPARTKRRRGGLGSSAAGGSRWSLTMLVFSAFPIANLLLGLSTKDYGLWYQVGLAVRQGLDIYPRPETGRLFPVHVSSLRRGDARHG